MTRPALEVADIFREHAALYRDTNRLSRQQLRAMRAIEICRTTSSAVMWRDVIIADTNGSLTTPVGIATALNDSHWPKQSGWKLVAPRCCPSSIFTLLSLCLANWGRWPFKTRPCFTICCLKRPLKLSFASPPTQSILARESVSSPCCIHGVKPSGRILTHDAWHYHLL